VSFAIHTARRVPPIDYKGVPESFKGKLSAVCRTAEDCYDLTRWYGDPSFCPLLPVMVIVPGADAPTLIPGFGYATAAELRDCAVVAWHTQEKKIAQGKNIIDFDEARERHGLMRREDVDAAVRQALRDRIAKHKANPISDPPRQLVYPKPTGKTVFGYEGATA
jgi:hypothetical protein